MRFTTPAALLLAALSALLTACLPVVVGGVGVGAMMADDRRTGGIYIEDERIELRVQSDAAGLGDKVHVNAISFNRVVLLTGEVPDNATKAKVEKAAAAVDNVKRVQNEIVIGRPSTLGERSNDVYLTTRVKSRFLSESNKRFSANHVKVFTEAAVVYLMGIVSKAEANAAAEIAAGTTGVKRVVKVFEYTD
ncbi:MAG: BON domain-containing protein [Rhodocyclaceae bacterium]|nr:BON domain-containing protein [Rhodocyclaceae bacterium]